MEKESLITFELVPQNNYEQENLIPKLNEEMCFVLIYLGILAISIVVCIVFFRKMRRKYDESK